MIICDKNEFENKIRKVLITKDEIQNKIKETGTLISREYNGRPLLIVSILKGSFIFASDLIRNISIPCEVGFMSAESYFSGTVSTGKVSINLDLAQDISRYNVIIAEDIVDTGKTLDEIVKILKKRSPLSLKVVTLLDKPSRRTVSFEPDLQANGI